MHKSNNNNAANDEDAATSGIEVVIQEVQPIGDEVNIDEGNNSNKETAPSLWQRTINYFKRQTGQSIEEAREEEQREEDNAFLNYFEKSSIRVDTPTSPTSEDETANADAETTNSASLRNRNWFLRYFGILTFANFFKALKFEIRQVFSISWPMVINLLCYSILSMTDLGFVGRLGSEKLMAAAGVANAYTYCIAFVAFGMASGMDTLTSQAFGAKNFRMVSIVLLQAIIVCTYVVELQ